MLIIDFVKNALSEDIGRGDLFSLVGNNEMSHAKLVAKEDGILSGVLYAHSLLKLSQMELRGSMDDGARFQKGSVIMEFMGGYLDVLRIERTLLNMLQHSSGIATHTREYVDILRSSGSNIALLDTRKTRPLLRIFEKYSVRNGGARNHRMGLDDALMLKDTHLTRLSDFKGFIRKARETLPFTAKIEIEVGSLEEARNAMEAGADIIMCDNMKLKDISDVVTLRDKSYPSVLLEGSGNITKDNLLSYAHLGLDAISSGALIHQARWVDIHLQM